MKNSLTRTVLVGGITALSCAALLIGCGGTDSPASPDPATPVASKPDPTMHFNRVATFPICAQLGSSCEADAGTAAEIVAASTDGMTLIYTNSPKGEAGFVDITDPTAPKALGALAVGGEPTSVAVLGSYALVSVDTSTSFTSPKGKLVVIDIASRRAVTEIDLGGQPDAVAVSKDGAYAAVIIENQRDESLNGGALPQLPGGSLKIIDTTGLPTTWKVRTVDLAGIAAIAPTDAEPEYVAINEDNVAVVTLQENNHIALVDLKAGTVTRHFSAGRVTLNKVDLTDERANLVSQTETQADRLREPDGVTWISRTQFALANEGDLAGGSRSFTIMNTDGSVVFDSGAALDHLAARLGHYNDRRSDAKGNEPENVAFGRFGATDYLVVASERSSLLAVYDMSDVARPALKQALAGAISPEGLLTIPSRNLLVSASEVDNRAQPARAALNIYAYQKAAAAYPTLQSADRADGTPIPWAAMSGMAAAADGRTVYAVDDSFFRSSRIFEIDVSVKPALIKSELRIRDTGGVLAAFAATLPAAADNQNFDQTDVARMINADGTINLDSEGISLASGGGFWIASEGAGSKTAYETGRNITSANLIFKVSATGVIERVIPLPAAQNNLQARFGFEGVAEHDGKLVVAIQRSWDVSNKNGNPLIGVFDLATQAWSFMSYPIDLVVSPNGGWVGLSEISAIGANRFLVVERDNQAGPDARVKRLYRIDLTGKLNGSTLSKTLVRDLMPDLRAPGGLVLEKVEGVAVLPNGEVLIVTDNDGVDEHAGGGETQLIRLGKLVN
ncbi:MAG: esterase-like activity of phytase family protein [Rubrivivax sp.]|nr:esterase-like activity of phytase family protein [Rubrivivax sp.]